MPDLPRPHVVPRPDELRFADELDTSGPPPAQTWKLLIVDDEEEVHVITRMVMEGLTFSGRGLSFLSAYSASQARVMLREQSDIAVILLDVVMETGQSGLELVEFIRSELGNRMVRIILRTGQPGQAPEREVITRYDINDYKHKTELTAQKLFSAVTTAIRSYHDLLVIEKSRQGLDLIITSTRNLFQRRNMELFARGVLDQMSALLRLGEGCLFLHSPSGFAATLQGGDISVLAGTGEFAHCGFRKSVCELDEGVTSVLRQVARDKNSVFADDHFVQYFRSRRGSENLLYFSLDRTLNPFERRLIQVFSGNVAIALDTMQLNLELVRAQKEIILTLGECMESRSKETASHVRRVSECCGLLAGLLGSSDHDVELVRLASPMHDAGKIGIPDSILLKPGALTPQEFEIMKTHTVIGHQMLKGSDRPIMQAAATIAHEHHERWNGQGYPRGLAGKAIHPFGRMVCLIDVFDSLLSRRVYKEPWSVARTTEFIASERGLMFDPDMADALLRDMDAFVAMREQFPDDPLPLDAAREDATSVVSGPGERVS
jgi:response regulator RpfG family c-di-GMP phosphodiesterase